MDALELSPLLLALGAAGLAWVLWGVARADAYSTADDAGEGGGLTWWPDPPSDDEQQTTTTFEAAMVAINPSTYAPAGVSADQAQRNRRAFLDMIAYAEGTSGPDGYRTLFGGRLFDSFADHPRQRFTFTDRLGRTLTTTAAGRYQFLARTWDELQGKLQLPDFSPDSQDAAALELVRQRGALNDVDAGRLAAAVAKCAPIWASLPGAGYAQPERKLAQLATAFAAAGGLMEAS